MKKKDRSDILSNPDYWEYDGGRIVQIENLPPDARKIFDLIFEKIDRFRKESEKDLKIKQKRREKR